MAFSSELLPTPFLRARRGGRRCRARRACKTHTRTCATGSADSAAGGAVRSAGRPAGLACPPGRSGCLPSAGGAPPPVARRRLQPGSPAHGKQACLQGRRVPRPRMDPHRPWQAAAGCQHCASSIGGTAAGMSRCQRTSMASWRPGCSSGRLLRASPTQYMEPPASPPANRHPGRASQVFLCGSDSADWWQ